MVGLNLKAGIMCKNLIRRTFVRQLRGYLNSIYDITFDENQGGNHGRTWYWLLATELLTKLPPSHPTKKLSACPSRVILLQALPFSLNQAEVLACDRKDPIDDNPELHRRTSRE